MKSSLLPTARSDSPELEAPRAGRRRVVVGASVAAGAAVAAAALHRQREVPAAAASVQPGDAPDSGYRLTDHVRRYYETTRT